MSARRRHVASTPLKFAHCPDLSQERVDAHQANHKGKKNGRKDKGNHSPPLLLACRRYKRGAWEETVVVSHRHPASRPPPSAPLPAPCAPIPTRHSLRPPLPRLAPAVPHPRWRGSLVPVLPSEAATNLQLVEPRGEAFGTARDRRVRLLPARILYFFSEVCSTAHWRASARSE